MSIITYLKETRGELKHVKWLSRSEIILTTIFVLLIAGIVGYMLGFFDAVFARLLTNIF